ncbi:MAG TPA: sulfatase-like hydrolase/transferase, partial [Polyangiales bacterium]|nr:sulfatase-like hydrolase/transferase [Polyangiales bacterium]
VLGSLAVVPLFLAPLARLHAALREKRALLAALAALVLLGVGGVFAPKSGAAGLEVNPLLEFAISGVRYGLRQRDTSTIDMSGAPHFDQSLIRGKPAPVEPLEQLLATDKLPLRNANVILLVLESASVNQLPLWRGKTPGLTPRLTELSQHALMFDDYYTAAPVSMKSLFTLHCSSYPYPHPAAETYANPNLDCMSISEVLKKRGYRTALLHSGRFSYTHKDDFFRPRRYDVMRDADMLVHRDKYPLVLWGADDRAAVDDALEWLDQAPDKPFFLDLIFLAPHHPYTIREAPMPYGDKNDLSRYKNATQLIDSQIGRIWDWLVAHGKADNTLLVVVGDHGEAFGEHPGHFTHGTRIYEEAARTPMMLINPQLFKGVHTQRVGNHVDLVPTILDTLGIPAVARHQGHSLLRGFKPHILYFYADWYRHYLGLRDGQWKYIYDEDADQPELYDLTRDFAEKTNVAAQHADQVKLYRDRVLKWEGFYRELIPSYEHYVNSDAKCRNKPVCYLDDLRPVLQHGDMRKNRSWGGDYLRVGKRKGQRGLGVTPLSILRYNIRSEGYRKLIGAVGHHVQGRNANLSLKVSAEIYLDDKLIWSSGKLAADEEPHDFALDVTGGSVLELIGYDVDGENWRDYMDWLDVRLER